MRLVPKTASRYGLQKAKVNKFSSAADLLLNMNRNNSKNRNFTSKASLKQKIPINDNPKEVKKPLKRQIRDAQRLLKNVCMANFIQVLMTMNGILVC